jgi:hypothetical protein
MGNRRSAAKDEHTKASEPAFAALAAYCPDLPEWPQRWRFDADDLEPGQRIVAALEPFLCALLGSGLSRKTLRTHRDNLWLLGGELIRRLHEDPTLRRQPVAALIDRCVDETGGPLIYPRISETAQASFDTTCRKLHAFARSTQASSRRLLTHEFR